MSSISLLGFGNPLLDISATVDAEFLAKYDVKANDAILAEDKHQPLYAELVEKYEVEYIAGGATQNSIRVAQWMLQDKATTGYIGAVGKDANGEALKAAAAGAGVDVQYYEVEDGTPTGTCAVLITGVERSLVTNLAAANKYDQKHQATVGMASVEAAQFYYISGFFLTVSVDTIMTVGAHAAAANKTFMMNLAAPFIMMFFKDQLVGALKYCDYVFGNESEYAELNKAMGWGLDDLKDVAAKVAGLPKENGARGRVAVITQGAEPTIIATSTGVVEYPILPCPAEEIVDTNGAGDAWVGGFLAAMVTGKSTEDCTKAGAYAAKVIIGRSGCTTPATPDFAL